jgi:hypothetical protein
VRVNYSKAQTKKEVKASLRFEPHCKICKSDLATAILYLHQCENYSYKQLIERYKGHLEINIFNLSCHFQRHVEQSDIEAVEKLHAEWSS